MIRRTLPILALVAALLAAGALAVSATGKPSATAASTRFHLSASSSALRFNVHTIRVRHGRVTLVMRNPSTGALPHGIAVQGRGLNRRGRVVGPGHTSTVTLTLRRGTYTFYCPFDGHRAAGMRGRLVVR